MTCADCNHRKTMECKLRDEPITNLHEFCFMDTTKTIDDKKRRHTK